MSDPSAPTIPSDSSLIDAARAGDDGAYTELYYRHIHAVREGARVVSRGASDANDAVADAFETVREALQRGAGPDLLLRPYLLLAARRSALTRRLDPADAPQHVLPERLNDVLRSPEVAPEHRAVADYFAGLPEHWQLVLWHADVERRTPAEIAPLLGLSPAAVMALHARALHGLRTAMLADPLQPIDSAECEWVRPRLAAFERDTLPERERVRVGVHLEQCELCTDALAALATVHERLAPALIPIVLGVAPDRYRAKVLPVLAGGASVQRSRRLLVGATAAGAAAVLMALVAGALVIRQPSELVEPPVAQPGPTTTLDDGGGVVNPVDPPPLTLPPPSFDPSITTPSIPNTGDTVVDTVGTGTPITPGTTNPATTPPATTQPGSTQPGTTQPGTTQPGSTQPGTTQPGNTTPTTPPTTPTTPPTTPTTPPTTSPAPPQLTLSVTSPSPALAGGSAVIDIEVGNGPGGSGFRGTRPGHSRGTKVTVVAPSGLAFDGNAPAGWACSQRATLLSCGLPVIAPGSTANGSIGFDVPAGAPEQIAITTSVAANGVEPVTTRLAVEIRVVDSLIFHAIGRGEVVSVGNSVLTCANSTRCSTARNGDGDNTDLWDLPMRFVNGAPQSSPQPSFNSSSASLQLAGAPVRAAFLVWGGDLLQSGVAAPDADARGAVQLTAPSGAVKAVKADSMSTSGDGTVYLAWADVTDLVGYQGEGAYAVGNLQTAEIRGSYGGWSLIVVTDDATKPRRMFAITDPFDWFAPQTDFSLSMPVPESVGSTSTRIVVTAFEGELGVQPEVLVVAGTAITDINAFRGSVAGALSPSYINNFGVDVDNYDVAYPPLAGDLEISAVSARDGIRLAVLGLSVDLADQG